MLQRTRFAPSPTGLLHVGNAFAALQCQQWVHSHANAELILRIEDIDFTRCRSHFIQNIIEDLHWLGISWQGDIRLQSQHLEGYQQALTQLRQQGVIYPCFCKRSDIQQAIKRLGLAPHQEDQHIPYPRSCCQLQGSEQQRFMQQQSFAWRLDMQKAATLISTPLDWIDHHHQQHHIQVHQLEDIVIARKDIGISYHLAVVVDDAQQNISHIIRGEDLLSSTPIHRVLQALLKLPSPSYQHHRLILDKHGKRLAKRHQATTLQALRTQGIQANNLRHYLLDKTNDWPFEHEDLALINKALGSSLKAPHDSQT